MTAESTISVPCAIAGRETIHYSDLTKENQQTMKYVSMTLFSAALAVVSTTTAQERPNMRAAGASSARWVRAEAIVKAPVDEVWRVWTTSEGAEEFFAEKANIRLAIGGPYEIQFDPKNEQSGTKGLKVLSYAPKEMISFQWNAPTEYPEVRNGGTWVVVQMRPEGTDRTRVTVTHYGWKDRRGVGPGVCAFRTRVGRPNEAFGAALHRWTYRLE